MILFIDSSGFEELRLAVIDQGKVKQQSLKIKHPETEKVLSYIEKFLKAKKIKLVQLDKIVLVSGPGSFTGIRVAAAIGLAFSFSKKIPLFALTKEQIPKDLAVLERTRLKKVTADFDPNYGAEPNITMSK